MIEWNDVTKFLSDWVTVTKIISSVVIPAIFVVIIIFVILAFLWHEFGEEIKRF